MTELLDLDVAFRSHERFLWGLCYRMTGDAALADDLVQETFARALARPPADATRPLRPWLVRVATNLGIDALRRRRRRGYAGPWLPTPVETETAAAVEEPGGRYDRLESLTFAFLVALEALTPKQRAVLVLRDVLDYSVREVAETLDMGESAVKVTHLRARRAMQAYEGERSIPTEELRERTREALVRFVSALVERDVAAVEAMLRDDVRTLNDGGGEYSAARVPVLGPRNVARFYLGVLRDDPETRAEIRLVNGLPALLVEMPGATGRLAPRVLLRLDVDADGRVRELHAVVAPKKLARLAF